MIHDTVYKITVCQVTEGRGSVHVPDELEVRLLLRRVGLGVELVLLQRLRARLGNARQERSEVREPGVVAHAVQPALRLPAGGVALEEAAHERFRRAVMASRLLICRGRLQREGLVIHIIAEQLEDFSHRLDGLVDLGRAAEPPAPATRLAIPSRDFH